MSVHSDCGKEVKWVHRDDDPERWHPPLEFAGQAYVIIDDVAIYTSIYQRHECDPADMKKWLELKRAQAEIKGMDPAELTWQEERAIAKEESRKDAWVIACAVACPTCQAHIGELCYNMSKRKRGITENTLNPHPSRLDAAWTSQDTNQT